MAMVVRNLSKCLAHFWLSPGAIFALDTHMGYICGVDSPHLTRYEQISKTMILWIENHEILVFTSWIFIYINL